MNRRRFVAALVAALIAIPALLTLAPAQAAAQPSMTQLRAVTASVCGTGTYHGATVWRCYLNPATHRVEVTLSDAPKDAAAVAAARTAGGRALTLKTASSSGITTADSRNIDTVPVAYFGGSMYRVVADQTCDPVTHVCTTWTCSTAFKVHSTPTNSFMLTAGHCFKQTTIGLATHVEEIHTSGCPAACVFTDAGVIYGDIFSTGLPYGSCVVATPCYDIGMLKNSLGHPDSYYTNKDWIGTPTTTTAQTVTGEADAAINTNVYADGAITGQTVTAKVLAGANGTTSCATVDGQYVCGIYYAKATDNATQIVHSGDSGGPVVAGNPNGLTAIGIIMGTVSGQCAGDTANSGCEMVYTSVHRALVKLGVNIN